MSSYGEPAFDEPGGERDQVIGRLHQECSRSIFAYKARRMLGLRCSPLAGVPGVPRDIQEEDLLLLRQKLIDAHERFGIREDPYGPPPEPPPGGGVVWVPFSRDAATLWDQLERHAELLCEEYAVRNNIPIRGTARPTREDPEQ